MTNIKSDDNKAKFISHDFALPLVLTAKKKSFSINVVKKKVIPNNGCFF